MDDKRPNTTRFFSFSERDKISYYFKAIDETLEGSFKTRLKLLYQLAYFKSNQAVINNSDFDFGKLIREFPIQFKNDVSLFLEDPIFSISTNQWRNIAAHKSFTINKDNIVIEYGRGTIQTLKISYKNFYKIVQWTQDIYNVIRLGQVLTDLNYIKEIVTELGGTNNIKIRFESSLLHLIHNVQIVGFKFVSTEEVNGSFCLNLKGKANHDLKSSLIHASQFLDQLSRSIYNDEFVREKFQITKVNLVGDEMKSLASASVSIEIALKRAEGKITLNEYLKNVDFDFVAANNDKGKISSLKNSVKKNPFNIHLLTAIPTKEEYYSQSAEQIDVKQFIRNLSLNIFSKYLVFHKLGYSTDKIKINVGKDGSIIRLDDEKKLIFRIPAIIKEKFIQQLIILCVSDLIIFFRKGQLSETLITDAMQNNNFEANLLLMQNMTAKRSK